MSALLAGALLSAVACAPPVLRSTEERVTSPDVAEFDLARQVAGNSAFAFDLYRALREEEGNLFW